MKEKKKSGKLRIAFAHIPGEGWSAGIYYQKNLFFALRSLPDEMRPEILLLVSKNVSSEEHEELTPFVDKIICRPENKQRTFFQELFFNIKKKLRIAPKTENLLCVFLKEHGVDVFFTLGAPPPNFFLPFLSWIPDFQHLYYPEFFSAQELKKRDFSFRCSAERATRVILSSNSAQEDFKGFASEMSEKARVLSFVAQIPDDVKTEKSGNVCKKYNIPEKFILLPNQFWKHKNYETVIRALHIALGKEPLLTVVCTGNTNEYRDVSYFSKLLCGISQAGVRERMILLGLVPREDLFLLMRQAVAVLQPSLFEGWNTTIEEVKSLGKKLLVSDIPVHREQDAPDAIYFNPVDPQGLAEALLDVFADGHPGPDLKMEHAAEELIQTRTELYGRTFLSIAQEVVESLTYQQG